MALRGRAHGLQFEILAGLAAISVCGLCLVVAGATQIGVWTIEQEAIGQLRAGGRTLLRSAARGPGRLSDLAAVARSLPVRDLGGAWTVIDESGRPVGNPRHPLDDSADYVGLLREMEQRGAVVRVSGLSLWNGLGNPGALRVALPIETPAGERGGRVGRSGREELLRRLGPLLGLAGWTTVATLAVFSLLGAIWLRHRILLPVRRLQLASSQIAHGDLSAHSEPAGSTELVELAHRFNEMAQSLSEQRRIARDANRARLRGERLAAVGRLAAGVAHEVGNPLAAILGYTDLVLRDPALSKRSRDPAEALRREALRVRELLQELLDLARSSDVETRLCEPGELLRRVRDRMLPQPLRGQARIEVSLEPGLPGIETDPKRVEQLLANLIENAAFAVRGSPEPRLHLIARHAQLPALPSRRWNDPGRASGAAGAPAVAFDVIDNGPGISPEHANSVFDPFFTTKEPGEGTGLGLWNGHRIAELLGGRLEVASCPGRTCFSLILPLADRGLESDRGLEEARARGDAGAAHSGG